MGPKKTLPQIHDLASHEGMLFAKLSADASGKEAKADKSS
jgi:hypothetical protein